MTGPHIHATVAMGDRWTVVHFKYDPAVVAFIKANVPSWARKYDPVTHDWTIDTALVMPVIDFLRSQFGPTGVKISNPNTKSQSDSESKSKSKPRSESSKARSNWATDLFGQLPGHLREPAYKALVKVLHPDVGGDRRLAQQLNDAYDAVRRSA